MNKLKRYRVELKFNSLEFVDAYVADLVDAEIADLEAENEKLREAISNLKKMMEYNEITLALVAVALVEESIRGVFNKNMPVKFRVDAICGQGSIQQVCCGLSITP